MGCGYVPVAMCRGLGVPVPVTAVRVWTDLRASALPARPASAVLLKTRTVSEPARLWGLAPGPAPHAGPSHGGRVGAAARVCGVLESYLEAGFSSRALPSAYGARERDGKEQGRALFP